MSTTSQDLTLRIQNTIHCLPTVEAEAVVLIYLYTSPNIKMINTWAFRTTINLKKMLPNLLNYITNYGKSQEVRTFHRHQCLILIQEFLSEPVSDLSPLFEEAERNCLQQRYSYCYQSQAAHFIHCWTYFFTNLFHLTSFCSV